MMVGCVKEIKDNENRVGLVPAGVRALSDHRHTVLVETQAGEGSGISDAEYKAAGAKIVAHAEEVWKKADMIVKVKEPLETEHKRMRESQIVFTYFHLAPLPKLTKVLMDRKVTAVAYETIREADGSLPLLTPMSEVAGRMSIQVGAQYLEKINGGRGVLLGGVPGVPPAQVVILGGGIVGMNAAKMAVGMGANVTILDKNLNQLRYIDDVFNGCVATLASNSHTIFESVKKADLLVGAVLIPGAEAPKLVTRKMIRAMKKGAVIVDVAVDQGGCIETTHPTTHSKPTFFVEGILHYCVANMPGAIPRTSTFALTNATLPYGLALANHGFMKAVKASAALREGVNTYRGYLTYEAVAKAQKLKYTALESLL